MAEDISFEATVEDTRIPLGTAGQLVLTVHGTQEVDKIELPPLAGIESRYVGPSTQVKVINGAYSTAKAFTYMLLPLKEGSFTIPPVEVDIKGQMYRSEPIVLQVVPASSGEGQASADSPGSLQSIADKVRMDIFLPRTRCFVNEELPLLVRLYVQDVPMQDITMPDLRQEGFVLADYAQPRQYEETLNGRRFHVVEFVTSMTPLHPGPLTVGPAIITANLVFKANVRRNSRGRQGIFDDDFFFGILGGYEKKPITITATPVQLEVSDLPVAGMPDGFSGGIGRFTFDAEVSPVSVKVGDPLTLRMTVAGVGNLKVIAMPKILGDGFKVYEPKVREENGKKTLEQVLIPTHEEIREVPAVTFSYFDVQAGQYQSLVKGPFPIEVLPPDKGQEFQAIGFSDRTASIVQETFGKDIVFIKDHPGAWRSKTDLWGRNGLFLGILIVFLNLWGALLVFLLHYRRLISDASYARRASAYKEFRLGFKAAKHLMSPERCSEFYDVLMKSLRVYLISKLKLSVGEIDPSMIEDILSSCKIDKKEFGKLRDLVARADRVRFGGLSVGEQDMKRDLLDAEEIVEAIERKAR